MRPRMVRFEKIALFSAIRRAIVRRLGSADCSGDVQECYNRFHRQGRAFAAGLCYNGADMSQANREARRGPGIPTRFSSRRRFCRSQVRTGPRRAGAEHGVRPRLRLAAPLPQTCRNHLRCGRLDRPRPAESLGRCRQRPAVVARRLAHGDRIALAPDAESPTVLEFRLPQSAPLPQAVLSDESGPTSIVASVDVRKLSDTLGQSGAVKRSTIEIHPSEAATKMLLAADAPRWSPFRRPSQLPVLGMFKSAGEILLAHEGLDEMLQQVVNLIAEHLPGRRGAACMIDPASGEIQPLCFSGERRAGSGEQEAGSGERGARSREQGASGRVRGAGSREQEAGSGVRGSPRPAPRSPSTSGWLPAPSQPQHPARGGPRPEGDAGGERG